MKRILSLWLAGLLIAGQPCYAMIVGYSKVSDGGGGTTYTQVYADDFDRADSGTVGGSWTSETDTGPYLGIVSNTLQYTSSATTAGYVEKDFGTTYMNHQLSFDWSISTVTTDASNRPYYIASLRNGSASNSVIIVVKSTSTTLNTVALTWYDEAGTATTSSQSYTFAAGTTYSFDLETSTSTGSSTNNGTLTLKINGSAVISLTGLDTYGRQVRYARVGNIYTESTGFSRTLTWDNVYFGENDA